MVGSQRGLSIGRRCRPCDGAACAGVAGYGSFLKITTAGPTIVAILLIRGGVDAITGENGQLIAIGAAVYICSMSSRSSSPWAGVKSGPP